MAQLNDASRERVAAYAAASAALEVTYSPGGWVWSCVADALGWAASAQFPGEFEDDGPKEAAPCRILRCVFNPFRPLTFEPSLLTWNGGLISRLAQAAYDDRLLPEGTLDSARLAVLCVALEESGLADAGLLHLRGPGPHVLGCIGIDVLLGRS